MSHRHGHHVRPKPTSDCSSVQDKARFTDCEIQFQTDFCTKTSFSQELVPTGMTGATGQFVPATQNDCNIVHATLQLKFATDFSAINFKLTARGVSPCDKITAAHLHYGKANVNGPILVTLFMSPTGNTGCHCCDGHGKHHDKHHDKRQDNHRDGLNIAGIIKNDNITHFNGGFFPGTLISNQINSIASIYQAIREGSIYVNIHTEKFPNGISRGQIFSR